MWTRLAIWCMIETPLGVLRVAEIAAASKRIGGLVMGIVVELGALKLNYSPEMRAFLTTGILGGFTTFSAFSLDTAILVERHAYGLAAGYAVGSVAASVSALFFGLAMCRPD